MGYGDNSEDLKSECQDGQCDCEEEKKEAYVHPRDKTKAQKLKDFIASCKTMGNSGCGCGCGS